MARFQQELQDNPFIGVDLGDGKRKIRLQVASKGKGNGGMRVITFIVVKTEASITVYLITLYDKSEYQDVSDKYVDQVIKGLK